MNAVVSSQIKEYESSTAQMKTNSDTLGGQSHQESPRSISVSWKSWDQSRETDKILTQKSTDIEPLLIVIGRILSDDAKLQSVIYELLFFIRKRFRPQTWRYDWLLRRH